MSEHEGESAIVSGKEMRCWIVLALVLFWASLTWTLYKHLTGAPGGSAQETLRLVGTGFGVLMVTRFAWCLLREPARTRQGPEA